MINHALVSEAAAKLSTIEVLRTYLNDLRYNKDLEIRLEGCSQELLQHFDSSLGEAFEVVVEAILATRINAMVQELHDMGVDAQGLRVALPDELTDVVHAITALSIKAGIVRCSNT